MMQSVIDCGAAAIAWTVTLIRFRTVVKSKWNRRVLKAWSLTLWLSLFVTWQVDDIYSAVDHLTGVNNLAWLLSYLFLVPTVYSLCAAYYSNPPRWSRFYSVIVAVFFVVIFPLGPGRVPETLDHIAPANFGELAFLGLAYFYTATMLSAIPTPSNLRALKKQTGYHRVRTGFVLLALIVTTLNLVTKSFIYSFSFFFPSLPSAFLHAVTDLSRLWAAGIAVFWPLGLAPNGFYRQVLRPVEFLRKIWTCRELGALQAWLNRMFPPVFPDRAIWVDLLRNPDLHIYRRVISILDRKKMLGTYLEQNRATPDNSLVPAAHLYQGLQDIPETAGFDEVVNICRQISRHTVGGAS
jgi:hypothetical protein